MKIIKLVIVDDSEDFRIALKTMLKKQDDVLVIREASNGVEAIELAEEVNPDIIIMDGVSATKNFTSAFGEKIKIIAASFSRDLKVVSEMMNAGAFAFVSKEKVSIELYDIIIGKGGHLVFNMNVFIN